MTSTNLDGDGEPDAVFATYDWNDGTIVYNHTPVGATTATFAAPLDFQVGAEPYDVVAADFNGDGTLDLAFDPRSDDSVTVLMNECLP